jgi:probable HAF family extracellular repeat protein
MQDLGTLGGIVSSASDVNDSGLVVGWSANGAGDVRAFRHPSGAGPMQDLGNLGGDSFAHAINGSGVIVGEAMVNPAGTASHVFRYTDASGMQDLGTLGGAFGQAYGINTAGVIVGKSTNVGGQDHAFRYTDASGFKDLGTAGGFFSAANDVNDAGVIVGLSYTATNALHAALWKPDGDVVDIDQWFNTANPTEGAKWELSELTGINNAGIASGYGFYNDGTGSVTRGFILDVNSTIPEPTSAAGVTLPLLAVWAPRGSRHRART